MFKKKKLENNNDFFYKFKIGADVFMIKMYTLLVIIYFHNNK